MGHVDESRGGSSVSGAAPQPRIEFLLRRLILLAGEVRDLLAVGDWEQATLQQEEYDESFATLQRLAETGHDFGPQHTNELVQLRHVHAENLQLARELRVSAGIEIGQVSNVRKLGAYAPLGANHRPTPQFLDGSA